MAYFNYHAKAKNLIKNGELKDYFIVEDYNGISPALVLVFSGHKCMPIRQYRWQEYFDIIEKNKNK